MNSKQMQVLIKLFIIAALLLSIFKMPYDYYTLLRWLVFAASAYFAFESYKICKTGSIWVFGVVSLLFNPLLPVHFERITWNVIDIAVAILYGISMVHK